MAKRGKRRKRLFTTNRSKRCPRTQIAKGEPPPEQESDIIQDHQLNDDDLSATGIRDEVEISHEAIPPHQLNSDDPTSSNKVLFITPKRSMRKEESNISLPSKKRKFDEPYLPSKQDLVSKFGATPMDIAPNCPLNHSKVRNAKEAILIDSTQQLNSAPQITSSAIGQLILQQSPSNLLKIPPASTSSLNSYANEISSSYTEEREVQIHIEEDDAVNLSEHYSILDEIEAGNEQFPNQNQSILNSSAANSIPFITNDQFPNSVPNDSNSTIIETRPISSIVNIVPNIPNNSLLQSCPISVPNFSPLHSGEYPLTGISIVNNQSSNPTMQMVSTAPRFINSSLCYQNQTSGMNSNVVLTSVLPNTSTGAVPTVVGGNTDLITQGICHPPIIFTSSFPSHPSVVLTRASGSFLTHADNSLGSGILNVPKSSLSLVHSNGLVAAANLGVRMPCVASFGPTNAHVATTIGGVIANPMELTNNSNPALVSGGGIIRSSGSLTSSGNLGVAMAGVITDTNGMLTTNNTDVHSSNGIIYDSRNVPCLSIPQINNVNCSTARIISACEDEINIDDESVHQVGQVLTIDTELSEDEIQAEEEEDDDDESVELEVVACQSEVMQSVASLAPNHATPALTSTSSSANIYNIRVSILFNLVSNSMSPDL